MRRYSILLLAFLSIYSAYAQDNSGSWKVENSRSKSFIENLGQYDQEANETIGAIKYAADFGATRIYFGEKGISYNFRKVDKKSKAERLKIMSEPIKSFKDHKQKERLAGKFLVTTDEVNMNWFKPSSDVQIIAEGENSAYHSYSYSTGNGETKSINYVKSYETITYKNIFPNIDVEYKMHPEIGLKYAFILNPGAQLSDLRMLFDREFTIENSEVHLPTLFGDIIDHAPITFYQDNEAEIIESAYAYSKGGLTFKLEQYDATRTLVIDPWVQTPDFNSPETWDCIWELDYDNSGNVYVIGGIMPMQLKKYNSTGVLQWTHDTPYDTTAWLGTMATDNIGNTYVTNGTSYEIQKVDAAGNVVWNNTNPSGGQISTEFWNISFNCDQTRLLVGGTGGNLDIHGRIYDIDMNTGDINSSAMVTQPGNLFAIPPQLQEVRAMAAAPNGKYYFLTLDTVGYISDNLTLCPGGSTSMLLDDHGIGWGYKSEKWRLNNTGIKAIRADANFVYVNRGDQLQKRSLVDFSIVGTVPIPGGQLESVFLGGNVSHNAGIDVDDCGNIYVGSKTGVYKFDNALSQLAFYPTAFNVYDVRVSTAGDVVACGGNGTPSNNVRSGGVQSFAASACVPIAFTCCDATVCLPQNICQQDTPIPLTPSTGGGTWSGGPYISAGGIFDPAIAGPGTHTVTYTLPCGSETITLTIDPCTTIDICEEVNGDLTASNGDGNYTWFTGVITPVSTPISSEQDCIDCAAATPGYLFGFYTGCDLSNCTYNDTVWTQYATGITTGAPSIYPIQIVDGNGVTTTINNAGELVACAANPCSGISIAMNIDSQSDAVCNGGADGAATVSASGGAIPYAYIWTPGSLTGPVQTTLTAGTYNVAIQDLNGCLGSGVVIIGEPTAVFADITGSTPAACGASDGTATASGTGGGGTYSYSWLPLGGTNALATGLPPDTYTVTVSDQFGCSDDTTVIITSTNGPTVALDNSTDVNCFGGNDGTATVSSSGGTPTYTYLWMPGSLTGANQSALTADSYTITVTDFSGCTDVITIDITEPLELTIDTTNTIAAACGASDGGGTVVGAGGTGTLSYSWNPVGGTGATASGIPAGAYTVTVTDLNLCTATINFTIPSIGGPTLSVLTTTDVSCFGLADGEGTIEAFGGTAPLGYSWSPSGGTAATATGLDPGVYTVTVTDGAGCVSAINLTINTPTEIVVVETITEENCGQSDGAITLNPSGGSSGYTYSWTPNGQTTSSISGISNGSYGVTVTDSDGCSVSENYTVLQLGGIPIIASPVSPSITSGESVQLTATGGSSYVWTPVSGLSCTTCPNPIANPTVTTSYIVTGTDANGCSGSDTVTVFVTTSCGDIYAPDIFSPNGDLNNDYLCIYGNCIAEMKYSVFNRWGQLVFETETVDDCWDGNFKEKPMISGVYAYKLFVMLQDGTVIEDAGNVTLVR
jgi:gliding motility-associated-like protein